MKAWQLAAAAVPAVAVAGFGAALVWFSRRWIAPPRVVFDPPDSDIIEDARFVSSDGVRLAGWLLPGRPDRPALILCHGYQRSMEEPFGLAVELRARGYTVLIFDFRGCGRSEGRYTTLGLREPEDLLAATRWLRRRVGPDTPIGVLGISLGGAVAITAAAQSDDIAAVVTDSAFAHLHGCVELRFEGLSGTNLRAHQTTKWIAERMVRGRVRDVRPIDYAARVAPRPVLLIHGERDTIVPRPHLDELAEAMGASVEVWSIPDCSHAYARFSHAEQYVERIDQFFTRALAPATPVAVR